MSSTKYYEWWEIFCIVREKGNREEWDCHVYMGEDRVAGPFYGFVEARDWCNSNIMMYVSKKFEEIVLS